MRYDLQLPGLQVCMVWKQLAWQFLSSRARVHTAAYTCRMSANWSLRGHAGDLGIASTARHSVWPGRLSFQPAATCDCSWTPQPGHLRMQARAPCCSLMHTPRSRICGLNPGCGQLLPCMSNDWKRNRRDRKSTRLNSSHSGESRMPSSA